MKESLWEGAVGTADPDNGNETHLPAQLATAPSPEEGEFVPGEPRYIGGRLDPLGRPPSSFNPHSPMCYASKTDHSGPCTENAMINVRGEWGRCSSHGGRSRDRGKELKNVVTGQDSVMATERLVERIDRLSEDQDMASIEEQVALAASAVLEYIRNLHKRGKVAFERNDIADILQMTKELTQMTERRHKIREGQKYTVRVEVLDTMAQYVVDVVSDRLQRHLSDQPELWLAVTEDIAAGLADYKVPDGAVKR